jgi:hypothetical protein
MENPNPSKKIGRRMTMNLVRQLGTRFGCHTAAKALTALQFAPV